MHGVGVAIVALVLSSVFINIFPSQGHFVVLAISMALVFAGAHGIFNHARAERWVSVEATILDLREKWIDVILHYNALRHFYPEIRYQYTFQGVEYISDTVGFEVENIWVPEFDGWGIKTKDNAKFWYGWGEGKKITAYVNASNPAKSVIINKVSKKYISQQMALIFGGILIGMLWFYVAYIF